MDVQFHSPPKFTTDQSEIKGALQDSKALLKEQTTNVTKRSTDLKQLANLINSNFHNVQERTKKLTEWSKSLLDKKKEIEDLQSQFNDEHKQKLSEMDVLIQKEESKIDSLDGKITDIHDQINSLNITQKPLYERELQKIKSEEEEINA